MSCVDIYVQARKEFNITSPLLLEYRDEDGVLISKIRTDAELDEAVRRALQTPTTSLYLAFESPKYRNPQPYEILCEVGRDLSERNTMLYWAYECKHAILKWGDPRMHDKRTSRILAWVEVLKESMPRGLNFFEKLPEDDILLRLCWLVCMFNHLTGRDVVEITINDGDLFLDDPPNGYGGDAVSYFWENGLEGCPLPQASGGFLTYKKLVQ